MENKKENIKNIENIEEYSIEEGFAHLEELLEAMEKNIPIEESFSLYESGMKLVQSINGKLASIEERVEKINAEGQFEEFGDDI